MRYGQLHSSQLYGSGQFEEAIAAAEAEAAARPGDPEPLFNRGQALTALERFAEAAAAYRAALALDMSESALDPEAIDDELFFALRSEAMRSAADPERAAATLAEYQAILPSGRHLDDVAKWLDKIRGIDAVWYRDRA